MERTLDKFERAMLRLLVIDLALRRYHSAHRVFPNRLHLLMPKFLKELPLDPFTNSEFIYRRHGDAFELYSTGPKGTDAGGAFAHKSRVLAHQADLCLDVIDYPYPETCELNPEAN